MRNALDIYIINYLGFVFIGVCLLIIWAICLLNCLRCQRKRLKLLFCNDTSVFDFADNSISRLGDGLIYRLMHQSNDTDKERLESTLKKIESAKYSNRNSRSFVEFIRNNIYSRQYDYGKFWFLALYYYNKCLVDPLFLRKEFIYFLASFLSGLLFIILNIKYGSSIAIFSKDLIANITGLIGTLLVFYYGVAGMIDDDKPKMSISEGDEVKEKRGKTVQCYKNVSAVGLGLIAGSFLINMVC